MAENNCVVCFKNVRIYSVGECDHPVCYECSTRMRVLCRQNECPMCRYEMGMVVFTEKIRPFRRLKRNYNIYDMKYNIAFENSYIQEVFNNLLCYICKKCRSEPVFEAFEMLNEHMKRVHNLYCCDLCADNLKIFPVERRYYTKSELNRHKRIGDIDDRSHRGHPLCEFCNVRYVDRDELYKHLRKEHLFCHICDSEGIQKFYGGYEMLRDHYRTDHFLCEEGDCFKEQLTSVFPTEIDLKAHKALVHCKNLRNRQAVKQARTLDLEFTLAPRNNDRRGRVVNQENIEEVSTNNFQSNQVQENNVENIMESWEQAFPSLTNSATYISLKPKCIQKPNNRLVFNEQNFPALGSETNVKVNFSNSMDNRPSTSSSMSLQVNHSKGKYVNQSNSDMNNIPSSSTLSLTWVEKAKEKKLPLQRNHFLSSTSASDCSHKPSSLNRKDFPKLQNTICNDTKKNKKSSVSVQVDESNNHYLKKNYGNASSNKNEEKKPSPGSNKPKEKMNELQSSNKDDKSRCILLNANRKKVKIKPETFTTLNEVKNIGSMLKSTSNHSVSSDSGPSNECEIPIKTSKPKSKNRNNFAVEQLTNIDCDSSINYKKIMNIDKKSKTKEKNDSYFVPKDKENEKKGNEGKENSLHKIKGNYEKKKICVSTNCFLTEEQSAIDNEKEIKNNVKKEYKSKCLTLKSELNTGLLSESERSKGKTNDMSNPLQTIDKSSSVNLKEPPPGFDKLMTSGPPPGFVSIHECDHRNSTFSDMDVQSTFYNFNPNSLFLYEPPDEFESRNSQLSKNINRSLVKNTNDAFDDFKSTSLLFREGYLSASVFYLYCRERIKSNYFEDIFVDLVTLLPNIFKQQELWAVHQSMMPANFKSTSAESCKICLQILKLNDISSHYAKHSVTTKALSQYVSTK